VIAAAVAERRVIRKGASGTLRYRDLVKLNFSNNPVAACDDISAVVETVLPLQAATPRIDVDLLPRFHRRA
jgi:hypothetical protein